MRLRMYRTVAFAFLAIQLGGASAADTVKVAFIAPLSGTFALVFEENLKLFRAAADEVNAKGGCWAGG